eukprot:11910285-Karenia_brevis.AAC.1
MFASCEDLWSEVLGDESMIAESKMNCEEVKKRIRGDSDKHSLREHQQQMISLVWRGTGVDEL